MKQIDHFTGTAGKQQSLKAGVALLLMGVMLALLPASVSAQVLKPFTQRTSNYSPDMPIYHIKGDYTMIGNTNVTFHNVNLDDPNNGASNNSSTMKYVDVDGSTFPTINSSTAALTFSTEFGANPACSEVLYAGLYWTGRDNDNTMERTITGSNTHTLNSEGEIGGYTLTITPNGDNERIFTFTNGSESVVLRMQRQESYFRNTYAVYNGEDRIYNNYNATANITVTLPGTNYDITQLRWGNSENSCSATVSETYIVSRNRIKIKHANAPEYTEMEATLDNIYYSGQNGMNNYQNFYAAYVEVTDYVRQYGLGNYTVADLETHVGSGDNIGWIGGWCMVVVYENSKMKWRDITLFDGFARVTNETNARTVNIPISGFKTVQVGDINMKLGMMAAEGDAGINNDGCKIEIRNTEEFSTLTHNGYTSDGEFFNSSIQTGDNYRYPNYVNNTGIDIITLNINSDPNDPNAILYNEQTSTTFQFTSDQDLYFSFCFVMGVDAYIPEAEALSGVMNLNEDDVTIDLETGNYLIEPGKEITFEVEVKNFGTEDIMNAKLEIPLPSTIEYYYAEVDYVYPGINIEGYFDAERYANGVAGWNIDYIPSGDPNQVYARVLLTVKVTDDCFVLASTDPECELAIEVNGTLEGTSYVNGVYFKKESFISGFADETGCQGNAIRNDIKVVVNKENYVNNNCQNRDYTVRLVNVCGNDFNATNPIPFMDIYALYPQGSRFFNAETGVEYTAATGFPISLAGNDASSAALIHVQPTSIYSAACTSDLRFILDPDGNSFTTPTLTNSATYCLDALADSLSRHITSTIPDDVYFRFYKERSNSAVAYVDIVPPTDVEGTYTYYVRQFRENAIGCEDETFYGPITIEVVSPITLTSSEASPSCVGRPVTITGVPEGGTWSWDSTLANQITVSGNVLTIAGDIAGTYTVTYTHNNAGSAGYNCTNTARSYTHQIAATTNTGTLEANQTICQGAQIQPLQIVGHSGHVERWEWTTDLSSTQWDIIPNNTSSISTADLGELAVGTYYFKALVKDGNCAAEWTNIVTITVTDNLAPNPPTVTSPQYACIGTEYTIQPNNGNYQWYEQAIGGCPIGGNTPVNSVTVTVTDEWITRYVSVVDAVTHCVSNRAEVQVRPNLEPGQIYNDGQRECDLNQTATTIGSYYDAEAYGGGTVEYQWYVQANGGEEQLISGATSATFTPSAYMGTEGEYIFIRKVRNSACANWQQSRGEWRLVVGKPDASLEAVPGHATICRNGGVELRLRVPSSTAYSYQWYKDGNAIPNATGHEYIATEVGRYTAQVTHRASGCSATTRAEDAIEVKYDDAAPTASSATTTLDGCSIAVAQAVTAYNNVIAANASGLGFNISDVITPADLLTLTHTETQTENPTGACYQLVRTYTVTDQCGFSTTFTHTINVVDNVAPTIGDNNLNTTLTSTNCNFTLPDFRSEVRAISSDNCTAREALEITQNVAAGTTYTPGTTPQTVTVTVKDACGNTSTKDIVVTIPSALTASATATHVLCNGGNGSVALTVSGGTTPYRYAWSNGATSEDLSSVSAGTYTVTVTDANGCTATASATVNQPTALTASATATPVLCNGGNGSVALTVSGGTTPYRYAWSNGATSEDLSSVSAGTYTVTVTDANGCTATASATVNQPTALTVSLEPASETCAGNDGKINYTIAGGTANYTVVLSGGSATQTATQTATGTNTFTGLEDGTYTVTVTDGNNCVATATATIAFKNDFTVRATRDTAICSGATFTVNPTASHPAKYRWAEPTAIGITGATAGTNASNISGTLTNTTTSATDITYTVTATTENGLCTADPFNVVVTVYAPVTGGSIQKNFIVCNGLDSVVTLTNEVSGNGGVNGGYIWQSVSNGTTTTIEGANGETYTPARVVGTVQYQRVYTTGCGNQPSNAVSVTYYGNVNPGTVVCSGEENDCTANYCYGSNISVTLSTSDIIIQSGASYSIQWQQSVNGGDWTNIPDANATTYTYNNAITEPIKFRYTIQLPSCNPVPSNNVHSIGVWALPVVSIADVATLCPSAASTDITGTIETPTTPNYTYHWSAEGGLTLPNLPDPNLPESATSATSNTITGTFPTNNCNATYSASLYVVDGNRCKSNTATETFTVVDTEAPEFTRPADITIYTDANCTYDASVSVTGDVTDEADNCSTNLNATYSDAIADGTCEGTKVITRTWSLVDACGNAAANQVQTITVEDKTAPTFTRPADITIYTNANCTYDASVSVTGDVTDEADNCSTNLNATYSDAIADGTCEGTKVITRTWSLVDACGNAAANQVQTITVEDKTAPTFTRPADITIYTNANCTYDASVSVTGDVTDEADNCSTNLNATYSDAIADGTCEGTKVITRTWSLVDACGNAAANQVQTITVEDKTAPTFTRPADITIYTNANCTYDASVSVTGDVTDEADNCSTNLNATYSDAVADGDCAGKKIITRTWSLVDACGNAAADQVQTITVLDTIAPIITCSDNFTRNTDDGQPYATVTLPTPTYEENCSATYSISYSPATPTNATATNASGQYPLGVTTVTYSVVDGCDNANSCSFTVTVGDDEHPEITCPPSKTVACETDTLPVLTTYAAFVAEGGTARDNDGINELSFRLSGYSKVGTCPTTITRTYYIEDITGNRATCEQVITIKDSIAPVLTGTWPTNITGQDNCFANAVTSGLYTDDQVKALYGDCSTITVTHSDANTLTDNCGWTITRTYTITDACENSVTRTMSVSGSDQTAPALTGTWPSNITGQDNCFANADISGLYTDAQVEALYEDCSGITVTHSDANTLTENCGWTITRTYTITDACGKTSTNSMSVSGSDQSAPALTGTWPSNITGQDNCFANADISGLYTDDQVKALYGDCSTITVTHSDANTLTDNCGWTITRTYTITDACGKTSTNSMSVSGSDQSAPALTGTWPSNITGQDNCFANADISGLYTDAQVEALYEDCSGITVTHSDANTLTENCGWTITRTYTITDACGKTSTNSMSVSGSDQSAPALTGTWPSNITGQDNCFANADISGLYTDAQVEALYEDCSGITVTHSDANTLTDNCGWTITRTYTITDACGKTSTNSMSVSGSDQSAPALTGTWPSNITGQDNCFANADISGLYTDAQVEALYEDCSGITVTHSDANTLTDNCGWTITRTYTITDACGKTSTNSMSVSGSDQSAPALTGTWPSNITGQDNCFANADISGLYTDAQVEALYEDCSGITVTHSDANTLTDNCGWTITRTYTITDACNNSVTNTMSVSGSDQTAPFITCNENLTPNTDDGQPYATVTLPNPTYGDNCSATYSISYSPTTPTNATAINASGQYPLGETIVTYSVVDGCGNANSCSFTVTVGDDEHPEITCPPSKTVACETDTLPVLTTYAAFVAEGGTARDNDGINELSFRLSGYSKVGTCPTTITRTYYIEDITGNRATCEQVITIKDSIAPVLTGTWPTNITGQDNCFANAVTSGLYTDDQVKALYGDCSTITVTHSDANTLTDNCGWTITRTYTITDACENSVTRTMSVSGSDQTAPALTGTWPSNITGQDNCFANADISGLYTDAQVEALYEDCSGITVTHSDANTLTENCGWTITRTYTITDACGKTSTNSMSVSGSDQSAPALTGTWPSNITGQDNCFANADISGLYTDDQVKALYGDCSTITVTHSDANTLTDNCGWTITRTYTITDACGKTSTNSMSVSGSDQSAPALTGTWPSNITGQDNCFANADISGLYTDAQVEALYEDCSGITVTHSDANTLTENCGWTITRTYTITDACGKTSTNSMSVSGSDQSAPALTGTWPSNITGQDNCFANADISGLYTDAQVEALYEDCSGITVTHSDANTLTDNCGWTITRTYTITDACGKTSTNSMSVSGSDQSAPALTGTWPSNITGQDNCFANADISGLYTDAQVEALYEDCSGITVTHSDANTLTDNCGWTITRTYTITDACGKTSTNSMSVSGSDQSAPALTGTWPSNITGQDNCFANADISGLYTDAQVEALYEDCSGITVTHSDANTLTDNCGWTITRTYTITDACENSVTRTMSVSGSDQTAPALTGTWPSNITGQDNCFANADISGLYTDAQVEALYEDCSGITVTHSDANTLTDNCGWTITRTYTITDACGKTSTNSMSVSGSDQSAPALTGTWPSNITGQDNCFANADISGLYTDAQVEALYEDCSGITVTSSDAVTGDDCGWTVTRTYTITDACNNSVTNTMSVSGSDQTAPFITCNENLTPNTDDGQPYATVTLPNPTYGDNCSATYSISYSPTTPTNATAINASGQYPLGETIVTYSVVDGCGNANSCSFTVTVGDDEHPEITCPPSKTVACETDTLPVLTTYAAFEEAGGAATDNDGINELSFRLSGYSKVGTCPTTITRTYYIEDITGNRATCEQVITIKDSIAPALNGTWPEDITGQDNCFAAADISELLSDDAVKALYSDCSTITVTHSDANTLTDNCGWTITRTYTIKDACNNTVTPAPTMSVSGSDQTAPALNGTWPTNITGQDNCLANRNISGLYNNDQVKALYSDCSALTVTSSDAVTGDDCGWTVTRTYTITDACNNSVTNSMSVSGSDQTAPGITDPTLWPANITNQNNCFANADISGLYNDNQVKNLYKDCSTITVTHIDSNVSTNDCDWTIMRIYTVKDECGNTVMPKPTMSVSGRDQTTPDIMPTVLDRTLTATGCEFIILDMREEVRAISSDGCTGISALTVEQPSAGMQVYPQVIARDTNVIIRVTDACGNYSLKSVKITIPAKVVISATATPASICNGETAQLSTEVTNVVGAASYVWEPATGLNSTTIDNPTTTLTATGAPKTVTYTVQVTDANGCTATATTFVTVNPEVVINALADTVINSGTAVPAKFFTTPLTGGVMTYSWTRTNSDVVTGMDATGTGNVPGATLYNNTNTAKTTTITVTPTFTANGISCVGATVSYTITVNPTVVMNDVVDQAICHGSEIEPVTFGTTITDATSFVYNWVRTNTANVTGLTETGSGNIDATALYNETDQVQVTTFTVTPTYFNNGISSTGTPITFTITVNPKVVMNTVANQAICHNSAIAAVNFTTPITDGSVVYNWTRDNDNIEGLDMSGTGNIAAATLTNTTNTAQTTTITVTPVYANNGNECTDESITFTITVNPKVVMNDVADQAICHNSAIAAVNFTTPITDGSVVYNWTRDNDNIEGLEMSGTGNIAAATLTNTTNTAQTTTITVTPVYANNGKTCTDETITFTITVNPKVRMNTVANQAICHGSAIAAVNFTTPITDGSVVYNWTRDNDNIEGLDMSGTGNIAAATLTNTTNTAQTTTITVTPVYANNGNECTDESITFTITVNPKVVMNDVADQAICHNSAIAAVNFTTPITDGSVVYNWTRDNDNIEGLDMSGTGNIAAATLTNTTNTAQTTTIIVTPVYANNGNECTDESITFTITVNPKVVMNDVADQAICHGSAIAAVNFTTPITDGSVVYNWTRDNDNIEGLEMSGTGNIAAATLTNTTNTAQTTTITVTPVYANNGKTCTDETITFTITVNPKVRMNTVANQAICHGSAIAAVNFTTPITDGSVVYNWTRDNDNIEGLDMSGTGNIAAATLTNTTNTAQTTTITVTPVYANNGNECTDESITFTITVNPKVVMNDVADQAICHNSAIAAVNFTTPITDGSVVYNWTRDNDNIEGLDMSGTGNIAAATLTNTTNTAQTTTITVTPVYANNGNECTDESITFTITVNPKVVMNDVADQAICHNSAIAAVNFTTPITDGSVVYNWTRDNDNIEGLEMSGTGNIAAATLTNTTNTAQTTTITVTPVYANNGKTCTDETITFTITVNPKVRMNTVANQAICHGSAIAAVNFTTPITDGSVVYNWTRDNDNIEGLDMSGTGNIAAATLTNTTNTAQTTTITVTPVYANNGKTCTDETITFTITVNPKVVMNTVEDWTLCVGETSPEYVYTSTITDGTVTYGWSNDNSAIGLAASGTGNLPSFVAANSTSADLIAEVKVAPTYANNGISCQGDSINFHITVRPSITTPGNVEFTCPRDTTVVLSYSECEQFVNIGYPEFVNNMTGMTVNITNDAPAGNIFPEGTTIVTWTATDECGAALTCTQSVVIQFPSCGDSIADFDGYRYSSVRIGCQCWTGENTRSEHYSDGTPVDNFRYYNDSDSLENIYGKLYTWYTAVRVPEGDNNAEPSISTDPLGRPYVQGICPEGWALPTVDEYMLMIANSGDATHAKDGSNLYWLPGYEGQPPFSGFDAYGAGLYNGAIDRYQDLLGKTYFWTTLSGSGSETATTVEINYYCAEGLQTELSKGDGVSIRCIRKR